MVTEEYLIVVLLVIAAVYVVHRLGIAARQFVKLRGKMLVTCPETQKTAAVEVANGHAAMGAMVNQQHMELNECSRWPERSDCGQNCLHQIEEDPVSHQAWNIVSRWFDGKECVYCGKPVKELSHFDRTPALMHTGGNTTEWDQLPPENLPDELSISMPVCWSCHMIETFRRKHPDLVVERTWKH